MMQASGRVDLPAIDNAVAAGKLEKEKQEAPATSKRKNHNNIKSIGNPKTLKYLNLDLNSPMMRDAMN